MAIKKWDKGQGYNCRQIYWRGVPVPFSFGSWTAKTEQRMLIPILTLQPCLALQNWKRNRTKNLESFCRMIEEDICCLRINWKQRRTWSESLDPSSERWLQRSTRGATPWQDHIKGPRGQQCLWLQSLDFDRKSTPEVQQWFCEALGDGGGR